jgi:hypothetical protein
MPVTLKRSFSPFLITLYGLGTILGAGIYVLVGLTLEDQNKRIPDCP